MKMRLFPEKRDWLDYVGLLLLPAVVFVLGAYFDHEKTASDQKTHDWDTDNSFVSMMTINDNETQVLVAMQMIPYLTKEQREGFPADLSSAVNLVANKLAAGDPKDPVTIGAKNLLAQLNSLPAFESATQDYSAAIQGVNAAPATVYVQITEEGQRDEAKLLLPLLRSRGFTTPPIELVASGPRQSSVRYFSAGSMATASALNGYLTSCGFTSSLRDFTPYVKKPVPQIEIWIGQEDEGVVSEHHCLVSK